ncbi:MAG: hypothetical protein DWI00_08810 [Planctomycetota bacterium]|nr:MAG: hypothetical protein DWI00_08810 [Planctomycetota bacterium]
MFEAGNKPTHFGISLRENIGFCGADPECRMAPTGSFRDLCGWRMHSALPKRSFNVVGLKKRIIFCCANANQFNDSMDGRTGFAVGRWIVL